MHQPVNQKDHEQFRSLPYEQEQRLSLLIEGETIEHMKKIAYGAMVRSTQDEETRAKFLRNLNMDVIAYFNQLHAMEG